MWMLMAAMTSTAIHSEPQENATAAQTAPSGTVYVNGRVYTQDTDLPWARAFVTRDGRFVFVGSTEDALRYAGGDARIVDLQGRFVMPGIIDAHTHPGLVALSGDLSVLEAGAGGNEEPVETDRMPSRPKEATLAWLRRYVDEHPSEFVIVQGTWDVAAYLPHGPHKRDLDRISSTKLIFLFDNSGHSLWVNSAVLRTFGIDRNTPDLSENLSHFVRDENGEPTGWVKEFALTPYYSALTPDADTLKSRLLAYLNYMASKGITTLWDAGNFNMDDAVYQAAHDIAKEGNLPLRWEGSYHVWAPEHIETAADSLHQLRDRYAHGKLRFNTIKVHYDGLQDILTAAMLEPYATDSNNRGGVLFTTQRLSEFMRELDGHGIDLHLHAVGDRAARNILDAVEQAQAALERPLRIEVTLSHLFTVAETDIERFRRLNVHANFTPHWFGGTVFGKAREVNIGPERAGRSQVVGRFFEHRANVTLSSDVIHNARRVSPFIGIEMSMTRRRLNATDSDALLPPPDARISLEQALAGYTVNGAAQLGLEREIGTIRAGFLADFIVLPQDPFETDVQSIHRISPTATVVAGELRSGSLPQTRHTLPLVRPASNRVQEGLVRIINHSERAGTVDIVAIDDAGERFGPVTLSLDALEAVNFDATDLEEGNMEVNLSGGVGDGEGNWHLELNTTLDIEALAYIRSVEGFLNTVHDVVADDGSMRYYVPTFNPSYRSLLRLVNQAGDATEVTITGRDGQGEPAPEGEVRLTLPPHAACTVTALELESGDISSDCPSAFSGRFGNGTRKWRLLISADHPLEVLSLLKSSTGEQLANLSASAREPGFAPADLAQTRHTLPLVMPASNQAQEGLVRIINHSERAGTVDIVAIDDAGERFGPVTLSLDVLDAVNFDATDLEEGNMEVNLSGGVGDGEGNWHLELNTTLDIEALAYIRSVEGFLNSVHDVVADDGSMRYYVPTFNPSYRSLLRLVNQAGDATEVTITGRDGQGEPAPEGEVRLTLPPHAACTIIALELESGDIGSDCPSVFSGRFGNGWRKWRLMVEAERPIHVLSLLKSSTGEQLANLSAAAREPGFAPADQAEFDADYVGKEGSLP